MRWVVRREKFGQAGGVSGEPPRPDGRSPWTLHGNWPGDINLGLGFRTSACLGMGYKKGFDVGIWDRSHRAGKFPAIFFCFARK